MELSVHDVRGSKRLKAKIVIENRGRADIDVFTTSISSWGRVLYEFDFKDQGRISGLSRLEHDADISEQVAATPRASVLRRVFSRQEQELVCLAKLGTGKMVSDQTGPLAIFPPSATNLKALVEFRKDRRQAGQPAKEQIESD